jgi:hypothetical protein
MVCEEKVANCMNRTTRSASKPNITRIHRTIRIFQARRSGPAKRTKQKQSIASRFVDRGSTGFAVLEMKVEVATIY